MSGRLRSTPRRSGIGRSLVLLVATLAPLISGAGASALPLRPAIIVVHGGGWYSGSPEKVQPICEKLETAGFDCFTPRYTVSTVAPFPAASHDLINVVNDLEELGYTTVYGVGISAGGNLVAWLATHGWLDAIVTWSGLSDLREYDWERPSPIGWVVELFCPTQNKRVGASILEPVGVPHLILHARDEWVPRWQARAFGTPTWLDGSKHGYQNFDEAMPLTLDWLQER